MCLGQLFNSQNLHRRSDQRSDLLVDVARFIAGLRPKVTFVENIL